MYARKRLALHAVVLQAFSGYHHNQTGILRDIYIHIVLPMLLNWTRGRLRRHMIYVSKDDQDQRSVTICM